MWGYGRPGPFPRRRRPTQWPPIPAKPGSPRAPLVSCGLWAFDRAFRQLVADGAILNDQPDRVYGHGGRVTTRWYLATTTAPVTGATLG